VREAEYVEELTKKCNLEEGIEGETKTVVGFNSLVELYLIILQLSSVPH
jgi:hypothetical protein